MSKIIELETTIKVEITDEQYETLKAVDGEKATKFMSFDIDVDTWDIDVWAVTLPSDNKITD